MKKVTPSIWILLGLIGLYDGVSGYIHSSSGGLFIIMIPEEIQLKSIMFGIISLIIGIGLFINPKQQVRFVYSFPIWILLYITIGTIQHAIYWGGFDLIYIADFDFFVYLFFPILTLVALKQQQQIDNISLKKFIANHWLFLITGSILVNAFIYITAELLPYELFW